MPVVQNIVLDPAGNPVDGAIVRIDLIAGRTVAQPGYTGTASIVATYTVNASPTGAWSANLTANALLIPANTYYRIVEAGYTSYVVVPNGPGPYNLSSILTVPPPSLPLNPSTMQPFSYPGSLAVVVGTARIYNYGPTNLNIQFVSATVGTPPTGSALIVDIKVSGVTVFTIPGHRPAIAAGTNTSGKVTAIDAPAWPSGQYLTVDIVQVGAATPGADLTVQIYAS